MDNYNDFDWLNSELLPGEVVLWHGKPDDKKLLTPQDVFLIPFSILWGGFAIFWETAVISFEAPGLFPLFGLPFVCVGIYFMFGRFIHKKHILKNTRYVLTNTRAIIYNKGKISCCDYKNESTISFKSNKDGSGTITFGYHRTDLFSRTDGSLFDTLNASTNEFLNIPDAHNVYQIINQQKTIIN